MSLPPSSPSTHLNKVKSRLRIAVLSRNFSTTGGGAERYSIALVEQLAARHEIHVFAQEIDHQWPGITYHRVSAPLLKPRWINQLWFATCTWWTTRKGFDVVHSHENTWHGEIQTVHVLPVKYNLFRGLTGVYRALRWLKVMTSPRLLTYLVLEHLRYAKRPGLQVVVTSDSLKAIMAFTYPACKNHLSVITPGITMPKLPGTLQRKEEARAQLGLPTVGRFLLLVANDYRKKGLKTVLDAMARLPTDVLLAVVGNTVQIPLFDEQIKTLKLSQRIFFLGSLSDVKPAYEAADCLVHPTVEDTFAMVVLEAMAHGLPVIVSGAQYCGIAGLLQHNINALILDDPKDASQLQQAIDLIVTQSALRNRFIRAAIDFAGHYEWCEMAFRQEALYFAAMADKTVSIQK